MTKNNLLLFAFFVAGILISCQQDEWDKHYDRESSLPEENLYELIKQNPDLSKFAKLVDIADYDMLLSSTQTLTVWAPDNEALKNVDETDIEQVKLIVSNHISRFNISSITPSSELVRMINSKIYTFSGNKEQLEFANSLLLSRDKLAKNGILHTIDKQIPYFYNLYEYMESNENTSKIWDFISMFDEERFNEDASIPIGVDESGRTVYDTVSTSFNRLLDTYYFYGLGNINLEDSTYTMLMPTNTAWDEAYQRISPYFKTFNRNQAYADSVQDIQTRLAIFSDLIYRGRITDFASLDSLVATSGKVMHDPISLFQNTNLIEASNGLIYQTDYLNYNNTETWQPKIEVEAEDSEFRVLGSNTLVTTHVVSSSDLIQDGISDDRYIEVSPTRPAAQPSVTFEIPDVLAGKYDVYVVFIPSVIKGYMQDSTRVEFELNYLSSTGTNSYVVVNDNDLYTSPYEIIKMKVLEGFEFPVANYYDRLWIMDYYDGKNSITDYVNTTTLIVKTNVNNTEFNNNRLSRRFFVDKIIFEPVRN